MAKIFKILFFLMIFVFHLPAELCQVHAAAADFSGDPTTGTVPLTVSFTDQSTGSITSWEWAFGDDNETSTGQNPSHIYSNPGTYTVSLTVDGPEGPDTETKTDYITASQGSLMITLKPQGAVDAGAKWNVDGGEWQNTGETISNLVAGEHTLRFKDIDSWIPPRMKTVTVVPDQTTEILAVYSQETGRLPDTEQTKCYDNSVEITCPQAGESFYSQDACFLINSPSYTKLDANGNDLPDDATEWVMVRDNVTGLIWEVKTDDGSIHAKNNTYNWQNAQDVFIAQVNASNFGGHSDWRIPTIKELASITELGRDDDPAINTHYFPKTVSSYYWSSTTSAAGPYSAQYMNFYLGYVNWSNKSCSHYVRAVRGGQTESFDHLFINGDGTVTDTVAGLMWQQATTGAMVWEAALSHCAALSLAGYGDWHLPNRRELRSIVECDTFNPTIDTDIFPDTVSGCYWSSTTTTYANDPSSAWYIKFSLGLANWGNKSSFSGYVRAVRGGQNRVFGHLFILAPAQGSRWDIGSSVPITWETQDIPGNVKISISRQGGNDGTFETIAETTENDGTYDWTVTGSLSCNCVLKIEPLTDPSKATTQSLFTIASTTPPIATISGVPESPTNQTGAFLNVGGDAIISGVPDSPTQQTEVTLTINGPGVTHYKYKLDAYIICF